jgi:hypothetical protein
MGVPMVSLGVPASPPLLSRWVTDLRVASLHYTYKGLSWLSCIRRVLDIRCRREYIAGGGRA